MAYNAEMGASRETDSVRTAEVTAWLDAGGLVVAASERAARSLAAAFHRGRQAEGRSAWPAPAILDWQTFLHTAWHEQPRNEDGRLLLAPVQEQSIWATIVGSDQHMATLLEGPRNRIASLAMGAHSLLCSYVPRFLKQNARAAWQRDAENFSGWLASFDQHCRAANLLSPARLPLELIPLLDSASSAATRPPLLLAGFDRILPTQHRLFDAWGKWQEASAAESTREVRFYHAADTQSELTSCALWCRSKLEANPNANLLVITQALSERRGEIERAFHNFVASKNAPASASPLFEFTLGIPLSKVALARGAQLLLRWLSSPSNENAIAENELDWLLSTGQIAADPQECLSLQTFVRKLRRRGLERTHWPLSAFIGSQPNIPLPPAWLARITGAQSQLAAMAAKPQSPLDWTELVPQLLQTAGWPGSRPLSSGEFQTLRRWQRTVESCASLGFDGRRILWHEFLAVLYRALDETLFAPESRGAPIQIAGPSESAGLTADAIWFMGASETAWPSSGPTHSLLPLSVQRDAAMPHATSQLDWELARDITLRMLRSAPQVCFSYARQSEDGETGHSRLVEQLTMKPLDLPAELAVPAPSKPLTVRFEDSSHISMPPGKIEGGASVLTHQSQCPFKAFAVARLAAQSWQPAEPGLTAAQRGGLLHAVLHAIWAGPPLGIRTLNELLALQDRTAFVTAHVVRAAEQSLRPGHSDGKPRGYLELEQQRLIRLVTEWLGYEATRIDFEVADTEVDRTVALDGLNLDLRLDRLDRLNDDTLLVIDYKSGAVTPKSWQLPRPDDVQLPLYAGFALHENELLGGLVFARVRTGDQSFAGHVGDASATLFPGLSGTSPLVKAKLDAEMLIDWRQNIEQLARDFMEGRAEVDPRDFPKTCERCGLETLCRVAENRGVLDADEAADDDQGEPDE